MSRPGTSIASLGARLRSGATTAAEQLAETLTRLDGLAGGPWANLVVARDDPRARADAARADAELAAGRDRGALHGVCVAVKDNIDVAGLPTRVGSAAYADVPAAGRDAAVVARLRDAGAIVVAKTHLHELAYGPTGEINPAGPARHPLDPGLVTGGSSSGSAALVALGIVPVALGTDTGCSVRTPAALCGVTGLMPALGALPTDGVVPLSTTLDHVGLLAATPAETGLAWEALTGAGTGTGADQGRAPWRVGVLRGGQFRLHDPAVGNALTAAVDSVVRRGSTVVDVSDPAVLDGLARLAEAYPLVVGSEAYAIHRAVIEQRPAELQPATRERLVAQAERRAADYLAALGALTDARRQVLAACERAALDVLLLPTTPVRAVPLGTSTVGDGEPLASALLRLDVPFSALGTAAISVPAPGVAGLPVGLQVVGLGPVSSSTAAALTAAALLGV